MNWYNFFVTQTGASFVKIREAASQSSTTSFFQQVELITHVGRSLDKSEAMKYFRTQIRDNSKYDRRALSKLLVTFWTVMVAIAVIGKVEKSCLCHRCSQGEPPVVTISKAEKYGLGNKDLLACRLTVGLGCQVEKLTVTAQQLGSEEKYAWSHFIQCWLL